ncbi:hypothetical protein WG66_002528, partial [Moniliophthora roreri]
KPRQIIKTTNLTSQRDLPNLDPRFSLDSHISLGSPILLCCIIRSNPSPPTLLFAREYLQATYLVFNGDIV